MARMPAPWTWRRYRGLVTWGLLLFVPTFLYLARIRGSSSGGGGSGLRHGQASVLSGGQDSGGGRLPSSAHLRVVIRTHPPELLQLRSLIYSLRAAAETRPWLRLDFVLVPTEPGSGVTYDRLQRELNPNFGDVRVAAFPDSFYEEAKASNPFKCTASVRARYQRAFFPEEVHKYCDFEHYQYYAATDQALRDHVLPDGRHGCPTCTHLLVTNGDNGYAPDFFDEAFRRAAAGGWGGGGDEQGQGQSQGQGEEEEGGKDLVVVPFLQEGQPERPVLGIGGLDLGGVLMTTRVLDGGAALFMSSLPEGAGPKEVHDADYWFVRHAVDRGCSYVLLAGRVLMYHH